jgi:hypothetical protein
VTSGLPLNDERNGVWGVASYDAVLAASKDPARFSHTGGIFISGLESMPIRFTPTSRVGPG